MRATAQHAEAAMARPGGGHDDRDGSRGRASPYGLLAVALAVDLAIMFALTFVGVDRLHDVFGNLNRLYMAVIMVAPMAIVMIVVMRHMFTNTVLNVMLVAGSIAVFALTFAGIRTQTFVGNEQFLRSMIPHHSIAIKTCKHAHIDDPQIKQLCGEIIRSQQREIDEMRQILRRIDG